MNPMIQSIRDRAPEYGSLPFWSWNDKLEEEELRAQIRNMKALGMGGFFMHARGGLETEYLSDAWFDCINACIDEAKKQGMEAWSYDENGWPSGFGGGALLGDPENLTTMLEHAFTDTFPAPSADTVAVYVRNGDDSFTRVTEATGAERYLHLYMTYDESYVDTLNPAVTDKFIASTHEEYKRRLPSEDFGTAMPGFFTDEPQYHRVGMPYSRVLPEAFSAMYGYDLRDRLPALFFDFEGAQKFRFDYYKLVNRQFTESFIKKVYEWCEENGVRLTGHGIEEKSLELQMMGCAGVMPFYEYQHIPGIDYLCRWIEEDIAPKQLGSVCAQLGRKKAISEMFAACGWDVTPTELKRIADLQFACGVNLMCQHLYPYSERGQRKRDYPAHYSAHNPWQSDFGAFCTHYANLGAALSEGEEYAPVLVIHPMHSAYMMYKRGENCLCELDDMLKELSHLLGYNQIPYHYGDEWLMEKYGSVENGRLRVGRCVYDMVVVPYCYSLDSSTAALLKRYLAEGGRLWLYYENKPMCIDGERADMSWLSSNCSLSDIHDLRDGVLTQRDFLPVPEVRKTVRVTERGKLLFLANVGEAAIGGVKLTLDMSYVTEQGSLAAVDLVTLEELPLCGRRTADGFEVWLDFEAGESHLIVPSTLPLREDYVSKFDIPTIPIPEEMAIRPPVNMLTLDTAALSLNGVDYEETLSVMGIKDNLLRSRRNGEVWLRFTYEVTEEYRRGAKQLRLVTEPMNVRSIAVNGREVQPIPGAWWFDKGFAVTDILPETKAGVNEIVIKLYHWQRDHVYHVLYGGLSETMRNCLTFDTEVECVYLTGDFSVRCDGVFTPAVMNENAMLYEGGFVLDRQRDTCRVANVVTDGYPFFAGHMKGTFTYDYSAGKPTMLRIGGRYATCGVTVNGASAGTLLFSDRLDIGQYLREGANEISLDLCNSNRNLMGPHHCIDPDSFVTAPSSFSFEGEWDGSACAGYAARYAFVRYGIE